MEYVNKVIPQISPSFHTITNPSVQHRETSVEREFKRILRRLPRERKAHSPTLQRLQKLSEDWRERQRKQKKKKLHYTLVKGAKIKSAINKALNHTQTAPIHILDRSTGPPVLETNPSKVGKLLSNCLSHLREDPHFAVDQQPLNQFIHNLPKCPGETASAPLDMPTLPWLQNITGRSKPTKATGEDKVNYYVLSLPPPFPAAIPAQLNSLHPAEWLPPCVVQGAGMSSIQKRGQNRCGQLQAHLPHPDPC